MGRRAETVSTALVYERLHDLGPIGVQLEAVDSLLRRPPHPLSCIVGREDLLPSPFPAAARYVVRDHTGRGDLVPGAAVPFAQGPVHLAEGNPTDRGDTVAEPELVVVFGLRDLEHPALRRIATGAHVSDVDMHVDETRKDPRAVCVDLMGCAARSQLWVDGPTRGTDAHDVDDPVSLDDDVHRTTGRRARPVDQGPTPDDQAVKRPLTFCARRRAQNGLLGLAARIRFQLRKPNRNHFPFTRMRSLRKKHCYAGERYDHAGY